jgi:ATP-dependent Lhr-like helicase
MTARFHPLIETWFERHLGPPTEPQVRGWPEIAAGRDVLISAPTGSGKTLAAFLSALDDLVRGAEAWTLPDETLVVYVSPLKALTNDVRKNLEAPLAEIRALAEERGISLQPIRTAVRTGDTPVADRARMVRKPPHVLVTTPESLFIYLTAERSRATLARVRTIVVDEIHALAADKRGSHLMLTLARLDALVRANGGAKPQRISLSATVRPIDEVANFVSPGCTIVDVGHRRAMEISVEVPRDELGHVATNEMWSEIYDRIADLIRAHRTTLIFVGTRRLAERIAFALAERLGPGMVLPHHGSLARPLRLETETKLKAGELRAVVATASLELGIDIGTIDLAVQIGSPRSIAIALQRIGRSGHWVGAKPKGVLFATTRDELIECAAVVRAIRAGEMDRLRIPNAPLDILAQQIVAACAADDWLEDDLFAVVRSARPYADLPRADFDAVLSMLGDGIATARGRAGTFLHRDLVNGRVRARRGARMAAIMSGGAIPDRADYNVVMEPDGQRVGTVDEDFAVESMAGDIFLLGQTSWKIRRVENGTVRVENAHGAPPSIPFWRGEGLGRTMELSVDVARVRESVAAYADDGEARAFLREACGLDRAGAEQLVAYVRAGAAALGGYVPSDTTIVAERFFDEAGGMQLVLHAPFGARINRAWGLALRKRFCRSFDIELQAAATDNGIVISLSEQHAFPLDAVFAYVSRASAEYVLTQALLDSPMFGARWRWNATRALAILRVRGGRRVAPQIVRMRSDDLLGAVFPDQVACAENVSGPIRIPDHVLVRETIDNCLHEAMDLDGLQTILGAMENGAIRTVAVETATASPFAHEILNASPYAFLDDAPLEERRARQVRLRSVVGSAAADGVGLLDPDAIDAVAAESWPLVRNADELHDALLTLVALPPVDAWRAAFETLRADRRAGSLRVGTSEFWVAAERLALFTRAQPEAVACDDLVAFDASASLPERDGAVAEIVRGWLESSGPARSSDLAARFAVDDETIERALLRLEAEGQVLRGRFRASEGEAWCNRRVLARIHRRTLGTLRREIEPVSSLQFVRFLHRWQHATPLTRLHGIEGTLEIVRQLEGFEIPAVAWEASILPRRVAGYRRDYLDTLCRSGDVMWGRLSTHPTLANDAARGDGELRVRRRIRPTKLVPISLFRRDGAETLVARGRIDETALSHAARDVLASIRVRRAPFFTELVRDTRRLASEVEEALFELVAAGLVSADGFDALRSLAEAKRRLGEGGARARPRASSGRWTLLESDRIAVDVEAFARRALARYGVVFRDVLKRETLAPAWRETLGVLRRLEAQGEIRGGRFVDGFVGEQFALPDALDALRAVRRDGDASEPSEVSSADPLHLAGVVLPARAPGTVREAVVAG